MLEHVGECLENVENIQENLGKHIKLNKDNLKNLENKSNHYESNLIPLCQLDAFY